MNSILRLMSASTLMFFQCLLLHPVFHCTRLSSKDISPSKKSYLRQSLQSSVFDLIVRFNRLIRILITPVIFLNIITFPINRSVRSQDEGDLTGGRIKPMYQASKLSSPSELGDQGYQLKSVLACICIYYSIKSLEWGFLKGPIRFRSDENRVLRDNDKTNDVDGGMKSQKQSDWNLVEMIGWTFAQITSARGIGFDWGPPRPREMVSLKSLVWRMYKVKLAALFAINFAVANRDSSTRKPLQVFVERLGIPNFIGLNLIAESLLTISFALIVCCSMDNNYSVLILIMSQFHKFFKKFKFRKTIVDYFDPVNWPPIYDSPHLAESLTDFWGNRWHKLLRRTFLISGGKPLAFIYQKISGSSKSVQMACLLLGSFISSGITHEY
ncbi:hypothetical protein BY996DRAFT_7279767, partial [Phakopsora pachyrhizi]